MPLFLSPTATLPVQAAPAVQLAPDSEARWIPFTRGAGNQILFTARINGHDARAVLDTGVSHTIVTQGFAKAAGLAGGRRDTAVAIGGQVDVRWTSLQTLAFGGLTLRGGRVGIATAAEQARFGADTFIGSDVLRCCAIDIDFDAGRFRLLPSGRLPYTGASVPIAGLQASGVPTAEIRFAGRRLRPMVVDTGDGSSVTFSEAAWLSLGYKGSPVTSMIGWGVGGAVISDVAIVQGLSLGPVALGETEVRAERPGGYSVQIGVAGRIGTGLLQRYRTLIDLKAGRMVLVPGAAATAPVLRSTSGLLMGTAEGQLVVLHVMRGSPAAEQGWRSGERICAVDGVPISSDSSIGWGAAPPGRVVRLTLCDGSARTLTLRRFY